MHVDKACMRFLRQGSAWGAAKARRAAHERPRASGSLRMSTMTAFWYLVPMPTMPVISCW